MAPRLTGGELDFIRELRNQGKTPVEIHSRLASKRRRKKIAEADLTTVRRVLLRPQMFEGYFATCFVRGALLSHVVASP